MICKRCGAQLRQDAKFCDECGQRIQLSDYSEVEKDTARRLDVIYGGDSNFTAETNIKDNQIIETSGKTKKYKKILFVGVIVVVIIVLIKIISSFGGLYSGGSYGDNSTEAETDSSYVDIQWISDRRVQYNSEDEQYVVFFGLQDSAKDYVSASGIASIKITDATGIELFNKDISFNENDFTEWTNQSWDSARFMCGIYIDKSDIAGSASTTGVLSLAVKCDTVEFEASNLSIYDLPSKKIPVILPSVPAKVINYDYRGNVDAIISVTKIACESEISYDSTATLKIKMNVEMIANYTDTMGQTTTVGYKLKNSEGIIVDSGSFYIAPMEVGEVVAEEEYIYNIDPNESYIMTFENTK